MSHRSVIIQFNVMYKMDVRSDQKPKKSLQSSLFTSPVSKTQNPISKGELSSSLSQKLFESLSNSDVKSPLASRPRHMIYKTESGFVLEKKHLSFIEELRVSYDSTTSDNSLQKEVKGENWQALDAEEDISWQISKTTIRIQLRCSEVTVVRNTVQHIFPLEVPTKYICLLVGECAMKTIKTVHIRDRNLSISIMQHFTQDPLGLETTFIDPFRMVEASVKRTELTFNKCLSQKKIVWADTEIVTRDRGLTCNQSDEHLKQSSPLLRPTLQTELRASFCFVASKKDNPSQKNLQLKKVLTSTKQPQFKSKLRATFSKQSSMEKNVGSTLKSSKLVGKNVDIFLEGDLSSSITFDQKKIAPELQCFKDLSMSGSYMREGVENTELNGTNLQRPEGRGDKSAKNQGHGLKNQTIFSESLTNSRAVKKTEKLKIMEGVKSAKKKRFAPSFLV